MFAIETLVCTSFSIMALMNRPQSSKDTLWFDAATHSTTHLVQASLRHGSSRGCDRMLERTRVDTSTHSGQTDTLFWLSNGG